MGGKASAGEIAILALMPLFFSSNLVIGRAVIEAVEPWTLAFLRWAGAFLILSPFVLGDLRRHGRALRSVGWRLMLLGFLGMWVCGALVYLALRHTSATNGTLIYTSSPVFILLFERLLFGRAVSGRQWLGATLAFLGVAIIVLRGDVDALRDLHANPGDLLMLAAAVAWAVYSVMLRAPTLQALPTATGFAAIVLAGTIGLLPFAAAETLLLARWPDTAAAWASIAALALFSSVLSFLSYQWSVRRFGAIVTGNLLYLLPLYGVGLAVVFLGERLHPFHVAGAAAVLAGVVLATRSAPPSSASEG